jgi:hypothetical protein
MENNTKKQNLFTKVYKRASKSPFEDHGTILWLACCLETDDEDIQLNYERYIYIHKSANGAICGISVSKQILGENPEFEDNKYMTGVLMYKFLLLHISEMYEFCDVFRDQFIEVFLIPPLEYFTAADDYWSQVVADADRDY